MGGPLEYYVYVYLDPNKEDLTGKFENLPFYDLTRGGDGTSGHKFTVEQRKQLSHAINISPNKKSKHQKIAAIQRGKILSELHKTKISRAHMGLKKTDAHIEKYTASRIANGTHKRSKECKSKISAANMGRGQTLATKQKRLASLRASGFNFKTNSKKWVVFDIVDNTHINISDLGAFCLARGLNQSQLYYTLKTFREHKKQPGFILFRDSTI